MANNTIRETLINDVEAIGNAKVRVKSSTELGQSFNTLSPVRALDNPGQDFHTVEDTLNEMSSYLTIGKDDPDFDRVQEFKRIFNETVDGLAADLGNAWTALGAIQDVARYILTPKLEDAYTYLLSHGENGDITAEYAAKQSLYEDFVTFNWGQNVYFMSSEEVAAQVNKLVVAEGDVPEIISDKYFQFVRNSLDKLVPPMQKVPAMTPEQIDLVKSQIKHECQQWFGGENENNFEMVFQCVMGAEPNGIRRIISDFSGLREDTFNNVLTLIDFGAVGSVCDYLEDGAISIPDSIKDTVMGNIANLKKLHLICHYHLLLLRAGIYKNIILLPKGLLNGDIAEEFLKENSIRPISLYLRGMYDDDVMKIPASGVSAKAISGSKEDMEAINDKLMANLSLKMASIRAKSRKIAAMNVFREAIIKYLRQKNPAPAEVAATDPLSVRNDSEATITRDTEQMMQNIRVSIIEAVSTGSMSFSDAAIKFQIELKEKGTLTETLYNALGAEYTKTLTADNELSIEAIRSADARVLSNIVLDFIFDKLIEVQK